jgi:hypothetical protein
VDVVNRNIDNFPVRLLAVEALEGECLNDHRDVLKEFQTREKSTRDIQEERLAERGKIGRFLELSRLFSGRFRERWDEYPGYGSFVHESYRIAKFLASARWEAMEMKNRYPTFVDPLAHSNSAPFNLIEGSYSQI